MARLTHSVIIVRAYFTCLYSYRVSAAFSAGAASVQYEESSMPSLTCLLERDRHRQPHLVFVSFVISFGQSCVRPVRSRNSKRFLLSRAPRPTHREGRPSWIHARRRAVNARDRAPYLRALHSRRIYEGRGPDVHSVVTNHKPECDPVSAPDRKSSRSCTSAPISARRGRNWDIAR